MMKWCVSLSKKSPLRQKMNNKKLREYAREAVMERTKGKDGYYPSLVDFIAAVSNVDKRTIDIQILRRANINLTALRENGL